MKGDLHVRFLGGGTAARRSCYPAVADFAMDCQPRRLLLENYFSIDGLDNHTIVPGGQTTNLARTTFPYGQVQAGRAIC
jgi:hypothetical protein